MDGAARRRGELPRGARAAGAARARPHLGTLVAVVLGAGCGVSSLTAPGLLDPQKPGTAFEGQQCSAIRPPTEPDLMAWDSGSRLNLKAQGEQGVVAVRYRAEGCNVELEVLNCVGDGTYRFSAYKANETKVAKSARDLYAELPIGAAKLEAKVGGGRALRTDYMLAGVLMLPVMKSFPPGSLKGDCDRATHVVGKLYLGGFAMAAGESEKLGAGASIFGVGLGGGQERTGERLSEEGSAAACQKAQDEARQDPLCSVPLRIGLVPIEGREAVAVTEPPPITGPAPGPAKTVAPAGTTMVLGLPMLDVGTTVLKEARDRVAKVNGDGQMVSYTLEQKAKEAATAGDMDLATSFWVAALANSLDDTDPVEALISYGRSDLVLATFQAFLPADPGFWNFYRYAEFVHKQGHGDVALAFADAMATRFATSALAVALAGDLHRTAGSSARACELFLSALDKTDDFDWGQFSYYRTSGCDLEQARVRVEAIAKRNGGSYWVQRELGELYMAMGRTAEGCRAFRESQRIDPDGLGLSSNLERCP